MVAAVVVLSELVLSLPVCPSHQQAANNGDEMMTGANRLLHHAIRHQQPHPAVE